MTTNACRFSVANTPGTGSVTVGAATSGPFRTLGAAHDGQSFTVAFYDGSAFEIAKSCVYTHSTTTLTRGTREDSSTGAALTLSAATQCAVVVSAGELTPLTSLSFTNLGTEAVPIWQLNANILPRTNTLANLKALVSGGGEIASATDTTAIVQLNGTAGSGTAAVFTPMSPGVWNDATYTFTPPPAVGTDINANTLTISGGLPTGTGQGGDIAITGSPYTWSAGGFLGPGNVTITGGPNPSNGIQRGHVTLRGGASSSGAAPGNAVIEGGPATSTNPGVSPGAVTITGGSNLSSDANGGTVTVAGGPTTTGTGVGGDVVIKGGTKPTTGTAGRVYLKDSLNNILMSVGGTANTLSFYNATPVTKPAVTGSRGGNAALASLLTQLAALGLITDSSSA